MRIYFTIKSQAVHHFIISQIPWGWGYIQQLDLNIYGREFKKPNTCGTWVAQLVKHPTSAQVMISWFVSLSPVLGSVLTAHSLEPRTCFIFCLHLFASPLHMRSLSLSLSLSLKYK